MKPIATLLALVILFGSGTLSGAVGEPDKSGHGAGDDPSGQKLPGKTPVVQLSADTDTKNAKLSLTFNLNSLSADGDPVVWAKSHFLSLVAATPIAQGQTYTNLATLDQLTSATTIKLKYLYAISRSKAEADRMSSAFLEKCYALLAKAGKDEKKACLISKVEAALDDLKKCGKADVTLIKEISDGIEQLKKMSIPQLKEMWLFGFNGQVGYDQHKYYDPATLGPGNATKTPFDIGATLAYVFADGHASFNLSADYQNAFKDHGMVQTQCKATAAPIISCVNGFIGSPTHVERHLIGLDVRYITKPFGFPIGIDPGVTYDAKAKSEAIQFPVYLMTNSSGGLAGGVRYDWTSEKHVSVIGIFASAAFGITGGGA